MLHMSGVLAAVRARALALLIPPLRLWLSEWIERELRLPKASQRCRVRCGSGPINARSPMRSATLRSSASRSLSRRALDELRGQQHFIFRAESQ